MSAVILPFPKSLARSRLDRFRVVSNGHFDAGQNIGDQSIKTGSRLVGGSDLVHLFDRDAKIVHVHGDAQIIQVAREHSSNGDRAAAIGERQLDGHVVQQQREGLGGHDFGDESGLKIAGGHGIFLGLIGRIKAVFRGRVE